MPKKYQLGDRLPDINLDPPEDEETCPACEGEGKELDECKGRYVGKCKECNGSGTVPALD